MPYYKYNIKQIVKNAIKLAIKKYKSKHSKDKFKEKNRYNTHTQNQNTGSIVQLILSSIELFVILTFLL